MVLEMLLPSGKIWKLYKIETKDIDTQAYWAVSHMNVGYCAMA